MLLLLVILVFIADLLLGSVSISVKEVLTILIGNTEEITPSSVYIIEKIRLPKALTAILVGSSLSVAGLQMQTLFRNPLAGPSILGITSGASLGVASVLLLFGSSTTLAIIKNMELSGQWLVTFAAILGSVAVLLVILLISVRIKDNVTLLIAGMMVGSITISVVSVWQYFSNPEQIKEYLSWTFGSLGGVTMENLPILAFVTIVGIIATFLLSKPLNALLLGEQYAQSLGFAVQKYRLITIIITSLLAGSATAFCGPIAFVGIAIPHLSRSLFQTTNHQILIPACILAGSLILLFCDILSQLPSSSSTLPINAITTLIGSPVVLLMVINNNNLRNSF